ncbi:spidroin-1-like [Bombina bombina]|uniref:spidroin-1-like n=1 Tax=Bombina bombina TaxID=8345 RepID=UPI00235A9DFE|nr:spidroin-1-like [Bombina bombina]
MSSRKRGPARQAEEHGFDEIVPPTPPKRPTQRSFNKGKGQANKGKGGAGKKGGGSVGPRDVSLSQPGCMGGVEAQAGTSGGREAPGERCEAGRGPAVTGGCEQAGALPALPPAAMAAVLALAQSLASVMPEAQGQGGSVALAGGGVVASGAGVSGTTRPHMAECAAGPSLSDGGSREMFSSSSSEEEECGRHLGGRVRGPEDTARDRSGPGNLGRLPVAGGAAEGSAQRRRQDLPVVIRAAGAAGSQQRGEEARPSTSAHAHTSTDGPVVWAQERQGLVEAGWRCESVGLRAVGPTQTAQADMSRGGTGAQAQGRHRASGHVRVSGAGRGMNMSSNTVRVMEASSGRSMGDVTGGRGRTHAGITHVSAHGSQCVTVGEDVYGCMVPGNMRLGGDRPGVAGGRPEAPQTALGQEAMIQRAVEIALREMARQQAPQGFSAHAQEGPGQELLIRRAVVAALGMDAGGDLRVEGRNRSFDAPPVAQSTPQVNLSPQVSSRNTSTMAAEASSALVVAGQCTEQREQAGSSSQAPIEADRSGSCEYYAPHTLHADTGSSSSVSGSDSGEDLGLVGKGQRRMFCWIKKMAAGQAKERDRAPGPAEGVQGPAGPGGAPPGAAVPRKVAAQGDTYPCLVHSLYGHLKAKTVKKIQEGRYVNVFDLSLDAFRAKERAQDGAGPKKKCAGLKHTRSG